MERHRSQAGFVGSEILLSVLMFATLLGCFFYVIEEQVNARANQGEAELAARGWSLFEWIEDELARAVPCERDGLRLPFIANGSLSYARALDADADGWPELVPTEDGHMILATEQEPCSLALIELPGTGSALVARSGAGDVRVLEERVTAFVVEELANGEDRTNRLPRLRVRLSLETRDHEGALHTWSAERVVETAGGAHP